MDKNNFKKNGMIRVLFETPEERARIIQILEKQLVFLSSEKWARWPAKNGPLFRHKTAGAHVEGICF